MRGRNAVAWYRCNKCRRHYQRDGRRVIKSFCERTGKDALLYRIKGKP